MFGVVRSTHLVCTGCRVSMKCAIIGPGDSRRPCPKCSEPMRDAGPNLAVPRRRDTSAWRALTAVLDDGLDFRSRCGCCQDGPGYRASSWSEVRRLRAAGEPLGD
ncbi:deoxyxylulose-5-phosphate synthase [Nocardia uniformis]|uniref:Deoxyxylulose-5-phosphate synthase n=1 Tax=Nocardia uniformis TaxID=53432 RepID=A0A849CER0_9NOCA|nr:hypothetical protein [Nocardia uniformis]NNH74857.1 deoxyxylulose-5-phosphate synthase [Nocardia uniformis]